jgi:hypothetical protein
MELSAQSIAHIFSVTQHLVRRASRSAPRISITDLRAAHGDRGFFNNDAPDFVRRSSYGVAQTPFGGYMARLPLGFDALIDPTSDPLIQLLLAEEEDSEADATESNMLARRESVLATNMIEQGADNAESLRVRQGDTRPGPCTIYRFK